MFEWLARKIDEVFMAQASLFPPNLVAECDLQRLGEEVVGGRLRELSRGPFPHVKDEKLGIAISGIIAGFILAVYVRGWSRDLMELIKNIILEVEHDEHDGTVH